MEDRSAELTKLIDDGLAPARKVASVVRDGEVLYFLAQCEDLKADLVHWEAVSQEISYDEMVKFLKYNGGIGEVEDAPEDHEEEPNDEEG